MSKKYEFSYSKGVIFRSVKRDERLRHRSFVLNEMSQSPPLYTTYTQTYKRKVSRSQSFICRIYLCPIILHDFFCQNEGHSKVPSLFKKGTAQSRQVFTNFYIVPVNINTLALNSDVRALQFLMDKGCILLVSQTLFYSTDDQEGAI